jgi:hypothetical protein
MRSHSDSRQHQRVAIQARHGTVTMLLQCLQARGQRPLFPQAVSNRTLAVCPPSSSSPTASSSVRSPALPMARGPSSAPACPRVQPLLHVFGLSGWVVLE